MLFYASRGAYSVNAPVGTLVLLTASRGSLVLLPLWESCLICYLWGSLMLLTVPGESRIYSSFIPCLGESSFIRSLYGSLVVFAFTRYIYDISCFICVLYFISLLSHLVSMCCDVFLCILEYSNRAWCIVL